MRGEGADERPVLHAGRGAYAVLAAQQTSPDDMRSGSVLCLKSRRPHIVNDAQIDQHFREFVATAVATPEQNADLRSIKAFASFPLLGGKDADLPIGALSLHSQNPDFFTESTVELIEDVARRAALALTNARLYAQQERRTKALEALREVERQLASKELKLDELMQEVAKRLAELTRALSCIVCLKNGDRLEKKGSYGTVGEHTPPYLDLRNPKQANQSTSRALLTREGQIHSLPDIEGYPENLEAVLGEVCHDDVNRVHGVLSVPLMFDDEAIGAITLLFEDASAVN